MIRWAATDYRDFWDFPRIFLLSDGGRTYLFDSPFSEGIDDFSDEYRVYLMPALKPEEVNGSWAGLFQRAIAELGSVAASVVRFDPTKRLFADASVLDAFAAGTDRLSG